MKALCNSFWGQCKHWWLMLIVGILLILAGFTYWFWPAAGYAVSSMIFGWLLVLTGLVQIIMSASQHRPKGWGWWLAGGVIDLFIGFALVRNIILSELVYPYFLAVIFIFWGVSYIAASAGGHSRKFWWLYLIDGILLLVIGFLFIEAGYLQNMFMVSFLSALAFIYWGFSIAMTAYDMRPISKDTFEP